MHSIIYLLHCNLHGICYPVGKIILCQQNRRYYILVCSYALYSHCPHASFSPSLHFHSPPCHHPLLLNAAKCEKLKVQNWLHRLHCNFLVTFLSFSLHLHLHLPSLYFSLSRSIRHIVHLYMSLNLFVNYNM